MKKFTNSGQFTSDEMRERWRNPEFRKLFSEKLKLAHKQGKFKNAHANFVPWVKTLKPDDPRLKIAVAKRRKTMLERYGVATVSHKKGEWHPSEEAKKRQSIAAKKRWAREHDKIVEAQNIGKANSELFHEVKSKHARDILKKRWLNPDVRKKFKEETLPKMVEGWKKSKKWRKAVTSDEYKRKISNHSKMMWADPEYKDRVVAKVRKALAKKPTLPERKLIKLLKRLLPNEYRYVGDGYFVVGGLCPDFVNVKGQKKIIEVFGRAYHDPKVSFLDVPFHHTEKGRKLIFARYGYQTLIVWDDEFNNLPKLSQKIQCFHLLKHTEECKE